MCVGLAEVWSRQRDFGEDSKSERLNYLRGKPVPLVRNREGQLLEASVHSSDAGKQAQQNNQDGQKAQGGMASQAYSQAQSSHRILRQKKPARPSTSKTGQK